MFIYRHDSLQQPGVGLVGDLSLVGPLLHDGGHLGVVHVEDPEACQVDPTEAVGVKVDGHQVLRTEVMAFIQPLMNRDRSHHEDSVKHSGFTQTNYTTIIIQFKRVFGDFIEAEQSTGTLSRAPTL